MTKKTLAILSADAFVANAPLVKPGPTLASSPVIWHEGISPKQLEELTGCVRKVDPNPFPGSLESWRGRAVRFILEDESFRVTRVIDSIVVKPLENVDQDDLKGTLAKIAMRELNLTFRQFFQEIHGGRDDAMVIRVRTP